MNLVARDAQNVNNMEFNKPSIVGIKLIKSLKVLQRKVIYLNPSND